MAERQLDHHEVKGGMPRLPLVLLLDSVELLVNVGGLFRLADALGLRELYLCGATPVPPNTKLRRAARSTETRVVWHYRESAREAVADLCAQGVRPLCLELTDHSQPLDTLVIDPVVPVCLIVGNERHGVDAGLLEQVGASVHIPMCGQNSSMNVTMAAAIACYRLAGFLSRSN